MARYYGCCLTTFPDARYSGGRRKCVGRRMLTMLPAQYQIPPKCPHCGGRRWYVDKQIRKRHLRERCYCSGLPFTHRRGSRYCDHHPDALKESYHG